jgi:DNA-binding transcriptional ArsR family regulator
MPSYRSDRGQSATCGRDHTSCQVETFFALTHPVVPTRLRIANLLQAEKEVYVCDLCEVLGELQPKVSRHLSVLREAELVQARSDGKWKFYALAAPPQFPSPDTPAMRGSLRGSSRGPSRRSRAARWHRAGAQVRIFGRIDPYDNPSAQRLPSLHRQLRTRHPGRGDSQPTRPGTNPGS